MAIASREGIFSLARARSAPPRFPVSTPSDSQLVNVCADVSARRLRTSTFPEQSMKTPSVSATEPRRSILSTMMSAIWPSRREKAVPISRPAFRLEALEPRILLSADFMPEAAAAMADGFNQLNTRMDQFLTGDAAFAERVPLLLKVTVDENDTLVSEAPTVGDLLTVPVDANGDGAVDGLPFFDPSDDDESTLATLDDDNDGFVDSGELLDGWFFDRVRDRLDTADDTRAEFVSFL